MATAVASVQIHTIFTPRFLNPKTQTWNGNRKAKQQNCFRQQACPHKRVLSFGGLCVGAQRSLSRGPALCVSGSDALCRGPALSVSGRGALCVELCRSLCRGPALSVSGPGASVSALSLSRPGALYVRARRSLCRAPVLSVKGLCRGLVVLSQRSLVGTPLFVSGPRSPESPALSVRAPAVSVSGLSPLSASGPGALSDLSALRDRGPLQHSLRALFVNHV